MSGFGDNLFKAGSLTGTTAAINVEVGFVPSRVEVINANSGFTLTWLDSMAAGYGLKADQNNALITTGGITAWAGEATGKELTGTFDCTAGSATVTGGDVTTKFTTELRVGDEVQIDGVVYSVIAIASATSLTVDRAIGSTVNEGKLIRTTGRAAGFTIGTDSDINTAHTLYWSAQR